MEKTRLQWIKELLLPSAGQRPEHMSSRLEKGVDSIKKIQHNLDIICLN